MGRSDLLTALDQGKGDKGMARKEKCYQCDELAVLDNDGFCPECIQDNKDNESEFCQEKD